MNDRATEGEIVAFGVCVNEKVEVNAQVLLGRLLKTVEKLEQH